MAKQTRKRKKTNPSRDLSRRDDAQAQPDELAYGFHAIESIINSSPARINEVFIDSGRLDQRGKNLIEQLNHCGCAYQLINKEDIERITGEAVHQGVVAKLAQTPVLNERHLSDWLAQPRSPFVLLILDQIQDPHNLGACLRTAEGAGVDGIIVPKNGACPVNQTVRKVAAGAADRVKLYYVTNLSRTLDELREQGVWITGATDRCEQTLYQCDFTGNIALAMGSEGKGLRRLTMEKCDQLAKIPMSGSVSSLNVSVATGIFLFEANRQRNG